MAQIIYRDFKDPSTKKNWVPKYKKYQRALILSIFVNLVQAIVIAHYFLK